jgi:hypothetical protein
MMLAQQWQKYLCNEDNNASAMRAMTPVQPWQRRLCNNGNGTIKTMAKRPEKQNNQLVLLFCLC